MPALILTPAERSALRAAAHRLSPVVTIGKAGLTEALLLETGRALASHGLIKVRAIAGEREDRAQWLDQLAERLDAAAVQAIGRILVLYRPLDEGAATASGKPAGGRAAARARAPRPAAKARPAR